MVQVGNMAAFLFTPNRESWCPGETGRRGLPRGSESQSRLCCSLGLSSQRGSLQSYAWLGVSWLRGFCGLLTPVRQKSQISATQPVSLSASPSSPLTFMHLTL